MKKSTASCFESQKNRYFKHIHTQMCEKCFVQPKNSSIYFVFMFAYDLVLHKKACILNLISFIASLVVEYNSKGGFNKNKLENSRIEKTTVLKKIGYSALGLKKPNFKEKIFIFKNLTRPKTVKLFGLLGIPVSCKIF